MKRIGLLFFSLILFALIIEAQHDRVKSYNKSTYMIPMRDGVKLFTAVFAPDSIDHPLPILMMRTPYGADKRESYNPMDVPYIASMAKEGYIFVFQDIRGKFKSEGTFEMTRPLYHLQDNRLTDESTDAYDAVDWMIKNIPNNNGKVGILGVSYLGLTALNALSDPHPALKAISPQASPVDMFLGDDFHHNGAFRLSYGFEYSYLVDNVKGDNKTFLFPQHDLFNWYLNLGPLSNVNKHYFKKTVPTWNQFVNHPNYDEYWKKTSMLTQINSAPIPVLHVGGYYDQEDLNGPQIMYSHLEKSDHNNHNFLLLGPWNHGKWSHAGGNSLGRIDFGSMTCEYFQEQQKQWFDFWLKGTGEGNFPEAICFQTGSNQWKSYATWPPEEVVTKRLYVHENGSCNFEKPEQKKGKVSYESDPAKPVPYRVLPIEATFEKGSRWKYWQVEDQRFAATRPDVVTFSSDSLSQNITVTGNVKVHLNVSTTGTDADFVVKLIDVYPDINTEDVLMSGYQFPVTMEVFRGRFRNSFEKPEPFKPGKPEEIVIDLHQINHTFRKGHKMMVQIQSSWFPLIDRNPQTYVPNIFEAVESDFVKATHTIYCNNKIATYIELPVIDE